MLAKVLQLKCNCNQFPWGKQGSNSLAATLCSKTPGTDFKIDENASYSEMWMGTYPELPSYVLETGEDLQDVLDNHPKELIGDSVIRKFNDTKLPYLPKAALGDFEAFCGFKPLGDIDRLLQLPPLQIFLPRIKKPDFDDQTLKSVVRSILEASDETIKKTNDALMSLPKEDFGSDSYIPELLPRLSEQYDKTDNGIVVALITMNYLQLKAGDSIYIPADGIHAYLSGDIIECMARSNNVLNTGFCPRADRDSAEMFCASLTFSPHDANEAILPPEQFERSKNGKTKVYAPPLSEFNMLSTALADGESETLSALKGPSIMIVTKGEGTLKAEGNEHKLSEGYIFFVGQGVELDFNASKAMQAFTTFVE